MFASHSLYLEPVFTPATLRQVVIMVHRKLKALQSRGIEFDTIAFRGNSGAGVAYPLSAIFKWNLCCVRKTVESSHGNPIEATGPFDKYVIVDDFVSSGATVRAIMEELGDRECVGLVCYHDGLTDTEGKYPNLQDNYVPYLKLARIYL